MVNIKSIVDQIQDVLLELEDNGTFDTPVKPPEKAEIPQTEETIAPDEKNDGAADD